MRALLWAIVFCMALWAASSDFEVGAVVAWLACMLAGVAAKVKSPRRASYKVGRPMGHGHEEPECLAIPIVRRELTLNGDPLQRVRKFKRVGSNLVVWLESKPVVVEIKAPLTWSQWGKSLVRRTPASSKPLPAGPVRKKVVIPWDKEKRVWKLTGKKVR